MSSRSSQLWLLEPPVILTTKDHFSIVHFNIILQFPPHMKYLTKTVILWGTAPYCLAHSVSKRFMQLISNFKFFINFTFSNEMLYAPASFLFVILRHPVDRNQHFGDNCHHHLGFS